jgi:hypothetical protein
MNLTRLWLLPALLIQLTFLNTYAADSFKNGEQLNVWNKEGLPLKQQPGVSGKNLLVIPYGQSVTLINDAKPSLPGTIKINFYGGIYKLKGNWVKVAYKGKQGYVFDGYLSKMPPLIKPKYNLFESEQDYLKRNYGIARVKHIKGKDDLQKNTIYYKNGNVSIETIFDGCFDIELYLKNITYQDAVLLLQATYSDADIPTSDLKIKKIKDVIKISYYACD